MNQFEFTDSSGVQWFKYTCSYDDQHGKQFCFDFWATSDEDSIARMAALRGSAKVDGRQCGIVEVDEADVLEPTATRH